MKAESKYFGVAIVESLSTEQAFFPASPHFSTSFKQQPDLLYLQFIPQLQHIPSEGAKWLKMVKGKKISWVGRRLDPNYPPPGLLWAGTGLVRKPGCDTPLQCVLKVMKFESFLHFLQPWGGSGFSLLCGDKKWWVCSCQRFDGLFLFWLLFQDFYPKAQIALPLEN